MELTNNRTLILDRELSDLDLFVIKFIQIIEKYSEYVIISGYVSILLGRSRATEDVDMFIKDISKEKFLILYKELKEKGFWCLNAENVDEVYEYLKDDLAIRFAEIGETIPNFEVKIARNLLSLATFNDFIKVKTNSGTINISSLERQIAFKRYFLMSEKDLEDAQHIEDSFKDKIDLNKIREYKKMIEGNTK